MNSQAENYGTTLASIGGYTIMADALDLANHWVIGVALLAIGAVFLLVAVVNDR